ncbi:GNAT family N-acetyltransferase [Roseovarius nanhaiticus]|uniref:GNAT family N-acetyltransferase n=1 Tax=Roseovarius nanhaiticus TaxID=573024 RepID=UPI0024919F1D|nr:GNAT family N-acetyltransferase [Roseovarius nanhaiticus]
MSTPLPDAAQLTRVIEATWPPAAAWQAGPWLLRDGQGGGKRVSAATAQGEIAAAGFVQDLAFAEAEMRRAGQTPLFMLRQGDEALDALLAGAGYDLVDPVNMHVSPLANLDLAPPERLASFNLWEPLAIQAEIWAAGGIGPLRLAVMHRVAGPKTALLGRLEGRAVGAGFVAIHEGIAMVHALEVLGPMRRRGAGRALMAEAAHWARGQGAQHLAIICTAANAAANALYAKLGMELVGRYHYRQHSGGAL